MKATGKHRDRKNGASREQWQKRKQTANAAHGKQIAETFNLIPGRHAYQDAKYSRITEPATPLD